MQALVLDSHERMERQVRLEDMPTMQRMLSSAASLDARSADSARDSDVKLRTAGGLGCQYGRRARCWSVGAVWRRCRGANGTKADRAALKAAGGPRCQYGRGARCWSDLLMTSYTPERLVQHQAALGFDPQLGPEPEPEPEP